ncbi:hypothetical protein CAC42_2075 [Sphaceloma murrayae]|uniref:Shugoshin n=1 Tax=Sphaceloma murrayae TaxID=2082308 RepID=A0A2K1QI56_9PEZI|nr:hypothetical protein CAC42_2075 [Sphaceloma murrayae]
MARLNEAPLQTETVEALKRRFIRQNRDLAKINTHQSLRIRMLEVEQSRLQTENLALREDIIRLQNQLSDSNSTVNVSELDLVRQSLQRKLEDILGVVSELGQLKGPERPKRQSDPSSWRPAIPNLRLAGQELRMPAIVEGKQYSRRTMDEEEIRALRLSDQSNESPDLGPPPVGHFDYADPIKFDRPEPIEQSAGCDEVEAIPAELAVNLETRRRRRDTQSRMQDLDAKEPDTEEIPAKKPTVPTRTSTKRKLSVCESEEPTVSHSSEPFNFTRKSASAQELRKTSSTEAISSSPTKLDMTEWINEEAPRERRVLGDKSVNMSPRKIVVGKRTDKSVKPPSESLDLPKPRARRPKVTSIIPIPVQSQPDALVNQVETGLPPKTPSASLFSPTSEPPSTSSTNPDTAMSANLEGMDGTTRPSRRARAAVSYAEPSLNTKMRRPTTELVAAIYPSKVGLSAGKKGEVPAKQEGGGEKMWRDVPAGNGSVIGEQKSPSLSRREGSKIGSPSLISKMGDGAGELEGRMRGLEIRGVESGVEDVQHRRSVSAELRKTRRHSSVTGLLDAEGSSSPRTKSSLENSPNVEDGQVEGRPSLIRATT